jgi:predicted Fe-Mo cluster-binding NifX family protein
MKIAIPVFHTKISPRFDQTQGFVLLETENAGVVARENLTTKGWSVIAKMKQLVDLEIDILICGGIDRASIQYLSFNGVNIYSWVTGEIDDAVTCFLNNRMKPGIILGDQGKMKGRWQFCKGRNHLCNMFETGFYEGEKGVKTMPRGDGTGPKGQGPRSGMGGGGCRAGQKNRGSGGQGRGQGSGQGKGGGSGQGRDGGVKGRRNGNNE